jgi:hypothetical protein
MCSHLTGCLVMLKSCLCSAFGKEIFKSLKFKYFVIRKSAGKTQILPSVTHKIDYVRVLAIKKGK